MSTASSRPLPGVEPLESEDTEAALRQILTDPRLLEEFEREGEADFAYSIPGLSRFRVNAFRQRGSVSIACRAIPFQVRTIEDLGLPPAIRRLADEQRGIVLLTGTTGSGKSTTLAAMVDHINSTRARQRDHARGPDRVPAPRQALDRQPARGRLGHRELRPRDAPGPAPGPGRDPDRRDARRGDRAHGAGRGRDRSPRALDPAHAGRDRDREPDHRLLPAAPPAAGAGDARRHPARRRRAAARAPLRRPRASRGLRGARLDRAGPGPDPQPAGDRATDGGDRRGRVLRDADLRPGAARARDGGDVDEATAFEYASSPHDFKLMLAARGQRASGIEQVLEGGEQGESEPSLASP